MRVSSGATATAAMANPSRIAASRQVKNGLRLIESACPSAAALQEKQRTIAKPAFLMSDNSNPHCDLLRLLEVGEETVIGLASDVCIFDEGIDLVVDIV